MNVAYRQDPAVVTDSFSASRRLLDELIVQTSSCDALATGHAEVEEVIRTAGSVLLRQLFQDHLDLRTARERRVDVVDEEGARLPGRRVTKRTLRSLLGPVVTTRFLYQAAGREGRAPADAGLRLCDDGYSMGVRREVARLCANDAYAPAIETLERLTGAHVPQRQAEELARRAAEDGGCMRVL